MFHHTCDDLARRVQLAQSLVVDRYTLLGCAGLLRKLLLDERPLATQANRNRRLAFDFAAHELGRTVLIGDPNQVAYGVWFQGLSMFPGNSQTPIVRMSRVNQWIAHVTGRVGDDDITIGQLIKFGAHVEGGVHIGDPTSRAEQRMAHLIPPFLKPDVPARQVLGSPLGTLAFVAHATLEGLKPLRDAVLTDWPELASRN